MKKSISPIEALRKLIPIAITDHEIDQLKIFVTSLREWNQRFNLLSRKDMDHIWEHHIFPSLIPITLIKFPKDFWLLDIGSGGGLPAIPIKIVRPDLQMLLVDSVRKKTLFLQKVISDLQLKNIAVKRERIEILQSNAIFDEKFDIITARAVANIPQLLQWSKPLLKGNGFFLLWKGFSDVEELNGIAKELELSYEILSVPDQFKNISKKFEELRFFKIWFK